LLFLILIVFFIANYITYQGLKRLEPHSKERTQLPKPVNILRVVKLLSIDNMTQELFCEAVAVMVKGVVFLTDPELSELSHYIIDLTFAVVSHSNWESLLKSEAGTVTSLYYYDT
jgi:predicted SprT family Zn-dependent metalloprotease